MQRWEREGWKKVMAERDTVWSKKLEEKQSGALIAKSELKERGRHAVIITDPI